MGSAAADEDPGEGDPQGPEQSAGPVAEDEVASLFVGVGGAQLLVCGDLDESGDEPEKENDGEAGEGEVTKDGDASKLQKDERRGDDLHDHERTDDERDEAGVLSMIGRERFRSDLTELGIDDELHDPDHARHSAGGGEMGEEDLAKNGFGE